MKLTLFLILLLTTFHCKAQHQADKIRILDSVSAKHGKISICGQDHYHPVDIKAKLIFDSLRTTGIDTLIIFRHWFGMNGFNGYGKVIWLDKGVLKQYRINFINRAPEYGIKSIDLTTIKSDSVFSFYFGNNLSSLKSNPPRKTNFWMSHDSNYFVYLEANNEVYCFDIDGLFVQDNPDNLRIMFLKKLQIESSKYIDEVYGKD
jgi:hypothetical protein